MIWHSVFASHIFTIVIFSRNFQPPGNCKNWWCRHHSLLAKWELPEHNAANLSQKIQRTVTVPLSSLWLWLWISPQGCRCASSHYPTFSKLGTVLYSVFHLHLPRKTFKYTVSYILFSSSGNSGRKYNLYWSQTQCSWRHQSTRLGLTLHHVSMTMIRLKSLDTWDYGAMKGPTTGKWGNNYSD